jgi:hypothetical protein
MTQNALRPATTDVRVTRRYVVTATMSHAALAELWQACRTRGSPELDELRRAIEDAAGKESVAAWVGPPQP